MQLPGSVRLFQKIQETFFSFEMPSQKFRSTKIFGHKKFRSIKFFGQLNFRSCPLTEIFID